MTDSPVDQGGAVAANHEPGLQAACEALLLIADQPVPAAEIARLLSREVDEVADVLVTLAGEYRADGRGFDLREVGGGWRYYTSEECAELVSRATLDGSPARLSQAALETLAIIAYRQPISRGRIAAVRGVHVDGVVRTLISRGLVAEAGTEPGSSSVLLATTAYFLERLGIRELSELPPLAEHIPSYSDLGDLIDLTEIE